MTAIETNGGKPSHEEERYNKVSENVLPASTQREKAVADSKEIKHESEPARDGVAKHEPEPARDGVAKINSDVGKMTVAETNGAKTGRKAERNTEGVKRGTTQSQSKPQTGHWVTKSVQETVTMSESVTTEAQVCFV